MVWLVWDGITLLVLPYDSKLPAMAYSGKQLEVIQKKYSCT